MEEEESHRERQDQRHVHLDSIDKIDYYDADLDGFTITLPAVPMGHPFPKEANAHREPGGSERSQQNHMHQEGGLEDSDNQQEQKKEDMRVADSDRSENDRAAVVNAVHVQANPTETGSFLVELPPGTESGNRVRAMLPTLAGELSHNLA
jgi:hypothetical protein